MDSSLYGRMEAEPGKHAIDLAGRNCRLSSGGDRDLPDVWSNVK